jgi:hypothetical protein
MKQTAILTTTSLLTLVLLICHLADDIVRGFEKGQLSNLMAIPICLVWLYATLVLAERRSGYIVVFVLSLFGLFVPYVHMSGRGVGLEGRIAHTDGAFFFVWTLLAMGATGSFAAVLAARALWRTWRDRQVSTA